MFFFNSEKWFRRTISDETFKRIFISIPVFRKRYNGYFCFCWRSVLNGEWRLGFVFVVYQRLFLLEDINSNWKVVIPTPTITIVMLKSYTVFKKGPSLKSSAL